MLVEHATARSHPAALAAGQNKAILMVQRAASLELIQSCGAVRTRVINETGHKLPTGHTLRRETGKASIA